MSRVPGKLACTVLRGPGRSNASRLPDNTAADHITVLDLALAQIPDAHRHGNDILIRCDSAGSSHAFLHHIRSWREHGIRSFFSVGVAITEPVRAAITACVDWIPAIDADRELRDGAEIAEITHLVDLSGFPEGTRMIARRERPHPGAQLSIFDTIDGLRHQVFITDTPRPACSVQLLELRHRGHARVEDRIRCGKDTGFGRFPSRQFAINAAWLELALVGIDLLAWTRTLLLDAEHALAEPKKLRYWLLHVSARNRAHRTPYLPTHRPPMALGQRPGHSVRPARRAAAARRLNPTPAPSTRDTGASRHSSRRLGMPIPRTGQNTHSEDQKPPGGRPTERTGFSAPATRA